MRISVGLDVAKAVHWACAPDKAWTVGDLQRTLLETLDLARLRAVDAEALDQTGHYLPALYLAFNANNDTVSTDLTSLTQ
jgi:hypothetical protein